MLNGHIHQVMQKVEGHVTFHTAMSTAFPQPAPGTAPSPGPDESGRRSAAQGARPLADVVPRRRISQSPSRTCRSRSDAASDGPREIAIDNFSFTPPSASVPPGTKVRWTNRDDVPHTVVSTEKVFKSPVLDTDGQFDFVFDRPGTYPYFCSIHPKMTGRITVG